MLADQLLAKLGRKPRRFETPGQDRATKLPGLDGIGYKKLDASATQHDKTREAQGRDSPTSEPTSSGRTSAQRTRPDSTASRTRRSRPVRVARPVLTSMKTTARRSPS